ncbi:alpha/beta hydrolase [Belnapia sp. T18]|uniref:Alpha/beta hydrolase n=1 Tax=Belnapia arida TaxID=2804533 RepID=A0ABS1UB62_9PROT|nr:alpha/beta hydrolase [Belnapia arida]MBL6081932.1 alpha/beta hydrolase [Belnapia arida]
MRKDMLPSGGIADGVRSSAPDADGTRGATGPSRRALFVGSVAAAVASVLPAAAQQAVMPGMRMVRTNGIDLAVYEAGSGPPIVLLHGFPGLAFTWRHQIPALATAGYRVIAPDLRGYGRSDTPKAVEDYDITHLTKDLVGLLDALGIEKAVFMGHDWGGLLAWQMALLHGGRVAGVIGVNTPHIPHWMLWLHPDVVKAAQPSGLTFVADPMVDPVSQMRRVYSPDMYVLMFQDGRMADEAMDRNPRGALRNAFRKNLMTSVEWDRLPSAVAHMEYYGRPLPESFPGKDVLSAQELDFYASHFERTGFTPAINWYRNLSRNWRAGLGVDQTVRVPSMMVSATHDVVLRPSMANGMDVHVPDLEKHTVADCWHWTPEEKPEELNRLAISWLSRRFPSR